MHDLDWGGFMALAGIGTVFAILLLLAACLWLLGRLDRRPVPAAQAPEDAGVPGPRVTLASSDLDGFTEDELAAIAIAVITHARVRRQQAAPAMRAHQPGSLLYASRWVNTGRAQQTQPWRRN